jgi:sugar lactone lactonase YvrE
MPSGDVSTFADPNGKIQALEDITPGPDGSVWFTSYDYDENGRPVDSLIGRITPGGEITTFRDRRISEPDGITTGPDGTLWSTSYHTDRIGRITTDGQVTMLDHSRHKISGPDNIIAAPDGNVCFHASAVAIALDPRLRRPLFESDDEPRRPQRGQ